MDALLRGAKTYVGSSRPLGKVSPEGIPEKVKVLTTDIAGPRLLLIDLKFQSRHQISHLSKS